MSSGTDRIMDSKAGPGCGRSPTAGDVRRSDEELDHLVRALSHDMSAHFMLLEQSVTRLTGSLDALSPVDLERNVTHVEACLRESKRFVNDLVDLAKTGRVDMDPGRVGLSAVIDEVLFEQAALIHERNVSIEVDDPLPQVRCNEHRVKQVITNLLRNAVLHGCDKDCPRIEISVVTAKNRLSNGGLVTLRFHDNGPGIDPSFHESIFLPGKRLAEADSDGSGMGLAIVKKIVEHYGGTIQIDPSCPTGTAFLVTLPGEPLDSPSLSEPDGGNGADRTDRESRRRSLDHDAAHRDRRLQPHQSVRRGGSLHGR